MRSDPNVRGLPASPDGFFFRPSVSTIALARRLGQTGPAGVLLSTFPGRLAWAAYVRRRVPVQAARVHWRAWRRRRRPASTTVAAGERSFRGALVVVVGPGEHEQLSDLVQSVRAYEGEDIKVVVADDATGQYPEDLVRRHFPGIDFVRARIPGGSASCSFRTQQLAFLHVLEHYPVQVVLKLDPDALIIAPGAFDLARARFEADPGLGVLGRTDPDYSFARWMAHPEVRWSRRLRQLVNRARRQRGRLLFAQGGAYFIAARALDAARVQRLLPFRQPSWSLLTEDVMTDLVVQAAGFGVGQFGLPTGPIASEPQALPFEPAEAAPRGAKIIHSVRATPLGASEAQIRSFFRAARAASDNGDSPQAGDPAATQLTP